MELIFDRYNNRLWRNLPESSCNLTSDDITTIDADELFTCEINSEIYHEDQIRIFCNHQGALSILVPYDNFPCLHGGYSCIWYSSGAFDYKTIQLFKESSFSKPWISSSSPNGCMYRFFALLENNDGKWFVIEFVNPNTYGIGFRPIVVCRNVTEQMDLRDEALKAAGLNKKKYVVFYSSESRNSEYSSLFEAMDGKLNESETKVIFDNTEQ